MLPVVWRKDGYWWVFQAAIFRYDRGKLSKLHVYFTATWVNAVSAPRSYLPGQIFLKVDVVFCTPAATKNSNLPEPLFSGRLLHFFGTHIEI
jgi:hypothetical protein